MDAVGHLNPMLAAVSALTAHGRGPRVRVYGSAGTGALFRATGAEFEALRPPPAPARTQTASGPSHLAVRSFLAPQEGLASLVEAVAGFRPDAVVHDVFDLRGAVLAAAFGIPRASLIGFAGLRALGGEFVEEHSGLHPSLLAANDRLLRDFHLDVLGDDVCLPVLYPSRRLSIVTAVEEQSPPPGGTAGERRLGATEAALGPALRWLGPFLGDVHWGSAATGELTCAAPRRRPAGPLTVLFSLGTNIATFRRGSSMGGAASGHAFVEAAVGLLLSAFGGDDRYRLLVATGGWAPPAGAVWPGNAVVAEVLPQRRLLADAADVFITHHGYNSTVEAVAHAVPMVAFPGYGDQIANAEHSVRRGVSVARWDLRRPLATCDADALRDAVHTAASPTGPRLRLPALRRDLFTAGGAAAAADLILDLV
ncbi:glycosyltransferase [Actinacidiphila yeochonensis]|uniref:glycosyltransferase n=1 Tax=Actinacidiphila yeochonensis TaxID=89050 RepID=UPI0012FE8957|nr:glycosyltransferase [Actinacidiphila yeochonensis]